MAANAGRKTRPHNLKIIEGRSEGRDSGGREIKAPPSFKRLPPNPPDWLGAIARQVWEDTVPELTRLELLKPVDGPALASYCEMVETFVVATKDVHENGLTVENHSTRKDGSESTWVTANPAVGVQQKAQAAIRAWCSEFGLTPAAEMKLATGGDGDGSEDENDPFGA